MEPIFNIMDEPGQITIFYINKGSAEPAVYLMAQDNLIQYSFTTAYKVPDTLKKVMSSIGRIMDQKPDTGIISIDAKDYRYYGSDVIKGHDIRSAEGIDAVCGSKELLSFRIKAGFMEADVDSSRVLPGYLPHKMSEPLTTRVRLRVGREQDHQTNLIEEISGIIVDLRAGGLPQGSKYKLSEYLKKLSKEIR